MTQLFGRTVSMGRKNALTAADAQQVEEAFRAKLVTLPNPPSNLLRRKAGLPSPWRRLLETRILLRTAADRQKCT